MELTESNVPASMAVVDSDGTTTQTRHIWLPQATSAPTPNHDPDGNLTNDGQWSYTWDAENRLVSMETTITAVVTAGRPYRKLTFAYDWTGRRLERTVTDGSDAILSATAWLYDGWNPVAEYSRSAGVPPALVKTYLWGLDLSGTLQGAGGVGGLLSVSSPISSNPITYNSYHPSYDGNGNITAWTQSGTTTPVNRREYDAFGNVVVEQGTPPCAFGFSTKQEDPETGLLYYGHRYYSPPLGRWVSQDPIAEKGGFNLYGFLGNDGVNFVDLVGLRPLSNEESQVLSGLEKEAQAAAAKSPKLAEALRAVAKDFKALVEAIPKGEKPKNVGVVSGALQIWNSPKLSKRYETDKVFMCSSFARRTLFLGGFRDFGEPNAAQFTNGGDKIGKISLRIVYELGGEDGKSVKLDDWTVVDATTVKDIRAPQMGNIISYGEANTFEVDTSHIGVYLGYGLFVSATSKIGQPTPVGDGGALIKFIPATIDAKKKIVFRSTK